MARAFICGKCEKSFTKKCNLIRHIKICSLKVINKIKNHIICPLCSESFFRSSTLDEHFEKKHKINIVCEEIIFSSEDDFHKWKEEVEKNSQSLYRKASINNKATYMTYFRCHRSGFFSSASTGKRKASAKGSCKIGGYCPSRIILRKVSDQIDIRYYPTHVGHDNDFRFLRLSKAVEETIAHKLEQGESLDHILDKRDEFIMTQNLEEKRLINRKKLHNIRHKYNIPYTGNYNVSKTKTNVSLNEHNPAERNQLNQPVEVTEEVNLCVDETTTLVMSTDINVNVTTKKFSSDEIYLESSNPNLHYLPSNSYVREEVCETLNDTSNSDPGINDSISDKLRQALHIIDSYNLKKINFDDQNMIISYVDKILEILNNCCNTEYSQLNGVLHELDLIS